MAAVWIWLIGYRPIASWLSKAVFSRSAQAPFQSPFAVFLASARQPGQVQRAFCSSLFRVRLHEYLGASFLPEKSDPKQRLFRATHTLRYINSVLGSTNDSLRRWRFLWCVFHLWFVQRKVRDTAARKAPGYVEKMEWISIISTFRLLFFFFELSRGIKTTLCFTWCSSTL